MKFEPNLLVKMVICAAVGSLAFSYAAKANDALVVYIECAGPDGVTTQGSGVLVSEKGHVLTARHVAPEGYSCQASIGNNSRSKRGIRPSFQSNKINARFDALLMEFGRDAEETFPFASVCSVVDELKGRDIIAKGFHANSFGAPSATDGILSNTYIRPDGIVETTAMTVNGKSGGPVFLRDTDMIVGIVAGAEFTAQGIVSSYNMLAVDAAMDELDLLKRSQSCAAPQTQNPSSVPEETLPETQIAAAVPEPTREPAQTGGSSAGSGISDPNFPEHIDGYNVSYIEYDLGHFKQTAVGQWIHHDINHNLLGSFVELGREEAGLALMDVITGVIVNFDGAQRMIFMWGNDQLIDQRAITSVQ